jgi:hypothetical protein
MPEDGQNVRETCSIIIELCAVKFVYLTEIYNLLPVNYDTTGRIPSKYSVRIADEPA